MSRGTCLSVRRHRGARLSREFEFALPFHGLDTLPFVSRGLTLSSRVAEIARSRRSIAPGAGNLVPRLIEQGVVDDDRLVNQLTLEDWIKIADTFDAWPFRPTVRGPRPHCSSHGDV